MTATARLRAPSLFISHGSPTTVLEEDDFTAALRRFGEEIPKPTAVVVISAHGISGGPFFLVGSSPKPKLWYDFYGFQPELYQYPYPVAGQPELAIRITNLLKASGIAAELNPENRLDHGVWGPLSQIFPKADVPVVELTMPNPLNEELLFRAGQALAGLREEGVLILGSGGTTHNLRHLSWHQKNGSPDPNMKSFEKWVMETVYANRPEELRHYASQPNAQYAHPTWEHFLPIFFTLGARLPSDQVSPVYEGYQYKTLSLWSFQLDTVQ